MPEVPTNSYWRRKKLRNAVVYVPSRDVGWSNAIVRYQDADGLLRLLAPARFLSAYEPVAMPKVGEKWHKIGNSRDVVTIVRVTKDTVRVEGATGVTSLPLRTFMSRCERDSSAPKAPKKLPRTIWERLG